MILRRPTRDAAPRPQAIRIFRFAEGRIVESWAVRDDLGTSRQLGHAPSSIKNADADLARHTSSADINEETE